MALQTTRLSENLLENEIFYVIYLDCVVSSKINPLFNVDGLYIRCLSGES